MGSGIWWAVLAVIASYVLGLGLWDVLAAFGLGV